MSLRVRSYFWFFILGAIGYWFPHIFIQWLGIPQPGALYLYTIILPTSVMIVWKVLYKNYREKNADIGLSLSMILGIWLFGPLAIAIGTMPHGGTFLDIENISEFLNMWMVFPASTMSMSLYSSSLGGLVLATALLMITGVFFWIRNYWNSRELD